MKSSQSTAQVEGAYRLIRNPSVSPQAIAEAGFTATVRACEAHPLLLALEDTTTINFSHSTASDDQGNTTTNPKTRGLLAHSVLMYAPDSALPVGFIEQQRWSRVTDTYGVKHQRKERPCEEKESYRWQQASERMAERLGEIQKRVITVCDRKRISGITCIIKSATDSASWCVLHRIAGWKKHPASSSNCRKSWQPREATR